VVRDGFAARVEFFEAFARPSGERGPPERDWLALSLFVDG
jgi:hypothetical protein